MYCPCNGTQRNQKPTALVAAEVPVANPFVAHKELHLIRKCKAASYVEADVLPRRQRLRRDQLGLREEDAHSLYYLVRRNFGALELWRCNPGGSVLVAAAGGRTGAVERRRARLQAAVGAP